MQRRTSTRLSRLLSLVGLCAVVVSTVGLALSASVDGRPVTETGLWFTVLSVGVGLFVAAGGFAILSQFVEPVSAPPLSADGVAERWDQ